MCIYLHPKYRFQIAKITLFSQINKLSEKKVRRKTLYSKDLPPNLKFHLRRCLFVYECPVGMLILPSVFRLRTRLCHVVKTTVITRSKCLISMKNGSHGLECDVIRFAHDRKEVHMTSFSCQFAQPARRQRQGIIRQVPSSGFRLDDQNLFRYWRKGRQCL